MIVFHRLYSLTLYFYFSAATVSWTCSQTRPWFGKPSRNLTIPYKRAFEISPVSSEPRTRPPPTRCGRKAAGADQRVVILPAVIRWPTAKVKGHEETRGRWTALWRAAWWETGCWLRICSSSSRRSGLKIRREFSRNSPIREHSMPNLSIISIKGKRKRSEWNIWRFVFSPGGLIKKLLAVKIQHQHVRPVFDSVIGRGLNDSESPLKSFKSLKLAQQQTLLPSFGFYLFSLDMLPERRVYVVTYRLTSNILVPHNISVQSVCCKCCFTSIVTRTHFNMHCLCVCVRSGIGLLSSCSMYSNVNPQKSHKNVSIQYFKSPSGAPDTDRRA